MRELNLKVLNYGALLPLALASITSALAGQAAARSSGSWTYTVFVDPIDDSRTLAALVEPEGAQEYLTAGFLGLNCDPSGPTLTWHPPPPHDSSDAYVGVTVRHGTAIAFDMIWWTDGEVIGVLPDDIEAFLDDMVGAERFALRYLTGSGETMTFTFATGGLAELVSTYPELCGLYG